MFLHEALFDLLVAALEAIEAGIAFTAEFYTAYLILNIIVRCIQVVSVNFI